MTFTSARLNGFEETFTSAGSAPVKPATTCLASSSSKVMTSEGYLFFFSFFWFRFFGKFFGEVDGENGTP